MMYSGPSRGPRKPPSIPHASSMAGAGVSVAFGSPGKSPKASGQRIPGVSTMPTSLSYDTAADEGEITRTHSGSMLFGRNHQRELSKAKAEDLSTLFELSDDRDTGLNKSGKFQSEVKMAPSLHGKIVGPGHAATVLAASKKDKSQAEQEKRDGVDSLVRTGPAHSDLAHQASFNNAHSRAAPPCTLSGKLSFASYSRPQSGSLVIEANPSFEENVDTHSLPADTSYDEGFEIKNPFDGDITIQEHTVPASAREPFGQTGNLPKEAQPKKMTRAEKRIFLARQALNSGPIPQVPGLV